VKRLPIGLHIRPMQNTDYHSIYRLYRQLIGKGNYCSEETFARIFKSFFEKQDREAFVADVQEQVIGFVTLYYLDVFHRSGQIASIQELIVTEEFRGRGVGKSLVEFVKLKLKERHCRGLEVATDLWENGAKSFYEHCGFSGKSILIGN
jgi:ribosomal protein S18 acetylase RimI-like enzyme